ncbi:hypothetical protein T08_9035 [Trichinella sp. T8]|nr:hypothetical protein T08_9035 [Trichinella sp. T8]
METLQMDNNFNCCYSAHCFECVNCHYVSLGNEINAIDCCLRNVVNNFPKAVTTVLHFLSLQDTVDNSHWNTRIDE